MKALLYYNPHSRRYRPDEIDRVRSLLARSGIEAEPVESPAPGSAPRYDFGGGPSPLCIIYGGDGTINAVVNLLLAAMPDRPPAFAVVPRGTANVLARELGLPADLSAAAAVIARGQRRSIHLGRAGGRHFVLMAGVGLDGHVIERTSARLKRRFGTIAFWISGLSALAGYRIPRFEVKLGREVFPATFAVIGNAGLYGGILAITPQARLEEAQLDVCLFNSTSKLRFFRYLAASFRGRHLGLPDVLYRKADKLTIQGDSRIAVQVDGELAGHLPMDFEVSSRTIEVVVP